MINGNDYIWSNWESGKRDNKDNKGDNDGGKERYRKKMERECFKKWVKGMRSKNEMKTKK